MHIEKKPSVRFAPSPTGPLHIGGVRTALFNYLFAKKYQGKFILRIEDTDQTRYVPQAEKYILDTLQWLGISADEDPIKQGPHAPYRQSERKAIYKKYVQKLVDEGKAYYAFDTPQALDKLRQKLQASNVKIPPYHATHRTMMENALSLPAVEVKKRLQNNTPYVIRLKIPIREEIKFYDEIRGWIKVHTHTLEDKILLKSDGMPTYHLANVVDDACMHITHVIRGEEWLPSTAIHILLYKYLGFTIPQFIHLPLLLKPTGKGKLSKRDAIDYQYPIFPLPWTDDNGTPIHNFKSLGYFPETLVNFLALLGWSDQEQRELLSKEELISAFSIKRIGSAGAKFAIKKAQWLNQYYLKKKDDGEIIQYLQKRIVAENITCTQDQIKKIIPLIRERACFFTDLWQEMQVFICDPQKYDVEILKKKWQKSYLTWIYIFIQEIQVLNNFESVNIKEKIQKLSQIHDIKLGKIMPILRIAITGNIQGPDLTAIMACIGKKATMIRLQQFCSFVDKHKF